MYEEPDNEELAVDAGGVKTNALARAANIVVLTAPTRMCCERVRTSLLLCNCPFPLDIGNSQERIVYTLYGKRGVGNQETFKSSGRNA